jgi:Orsellinic acid/F9775 biosynthesis cluster protein D
MAAEELLTNLKLYIDHNARVLVCRRNQCLCALSTAGSRVTTHLRDKHNVPSDARKGLTKMLRSQGILDPDEAPPREDGSPEHPYLRTYDGFACGGCTFRTVSLQSMKRHFSDPTMRDQCRHYGQFRSSNELDELFQYVFLQTWVSGPGRQYWLIERNGSRLRPIGGQQVQDHLRSMRERERERERRRTATATGDHCDIPSERLRAPSPGSSSEPAHLTFAEKGPWIERAGWEEMYRGKSRPVLSALMERPGSWPHYLGQDHVLSYRSKDSPEKDVISPAGDEQKMAAILDLFDRVMDRCEETARKTSRGILCWLRSSRPLSCYPKPFTFVSSPSTTKRYRLLFKRCLALVLRAYRVDSVNRAKLIGSRLSKKQIRYLESIWNHAYWDHANEAIGLLADIGDDGNGEAVLSPVSMHRGLPEMDEDVADGDSDSDEENWTDGDDDDDDDDEDAAEESEKDEEGDADILVGSQKATSNSTGEDSNEDSTADQTELAEELLEYLFGLTVSLCTQTPINGQPSSTILIYASGILGFSSASNAFLPARSYTSYLSGLIYIQRLVFLELALPLRRYIKLGIPQRPRVKQVRQLEPIRQSYMVSGAQSPFEEMMSLRNYGRALARTDSPAFLFRWSDDAQTIFHGDIMKVSMGDFRRLPEYFIEQAEGLCNELMLNWRPSVDLAEIKDDMMDMTQGFSFVKHTRNRLQEAYLELYERACTSRLRGLSRAGSRNGKATLAWMKKEEAFRSVLAGCMHVGSGQVPRCKELLSLWCVNGEFGPRGIYVYNGSMVYIIRHHKAKRSTNREFVVARFLPVQIGHLLYKYLVYIRPLVDMFYRESCAGSRDDVQHSPLLFRAEMALSSKPWPTSRFTSILKEATKKAWDLPVSSQTFRQLCIAISEKHVREVYEPFNRFDDTGANADRNVVFAWQSGHRPLQRGSTYGLDGAFPTKLQPQLLHLYRWASTRWHEFLHLPSKYPPERNKLNRAQGQGREMLTWSFSPLPGKTAADREGLPATESLNHQPTSRRAHARDPELPAAQPHSQEQDGQGVVTRPRPSSPDKHRSPRGTTHVPVYEIDSDSPSPSRKRRRVTSTRAVPSHTSPDIDARSTHDVVFTSGGRSGPPLTTPVASPSLFRHPNDSASMSAIRDRQLILKILKEYQVERSNPFKLERQLDGVYRTAEWWKDVSCELCFVVSGEWEVDHNLEACQQDGSDQVRLFLRWLETLDLPRSLRGRGVCSLCTHTWHPCLEICMSYDISTAGSLEGRAARIELFASKNGPDGHCERKPITYALRI